jgi:hypothetical protein
MYSLPSSLYTPVEIRLVEKHPGLLRSQKSERFTSFRYILVYSGSVVLPFKAPVL